MHGYQAIGKVTKFEFVEYYAHVSAAVASDTQFQNIVEGVWNMDNKDDISFQPFAGSREKVLVVSSKERYLHDHHRNLFGEDNVPYGYSAAKAGDNRWETSSRSNYH